MHKKKLQITLARSHFSLKPLSVNLGELSEIAFCYQTINCTNSFKQVLKINCLKTKSIINRGTKDISELIVRT